MEVDRAQQIALLRNLKGAPISVIWALLMVNMHTPAGAVYTLKNKELEVWTGYSDKPVSTALDLLHTMGMVAQNQAGGWYLTTAAYQLPLPLWLGDGNGRAPLSESSRRISPTLSSSSSLLTTSMDPEEEERTASARAAEILRLNPLPVDNSVDNSVPDVRDWLLRGGIGPNSVKMRQLLAEDRSLPYVKAHVLERLYHVRRGEHFPVGWLINKLECGDAAPPMRCEGCLAPLQSCLCGANIHR